MESGQRRHNAHHCSLLTSNFRALVIVLVTNGFLFERIELFIREAGFRSGRAPSNQVINVQVTLNHSLA